MKIKLKNILKATIFVTPSLPNGETNRYKLKASTLLLGLASYTIAISIITAIILGVSPLKNYLFYFENQELKTQAKKTIELEAKIKYLVSELNSISSTNKKLEYAILLATSDSLDTNSAVYDSLKFESQKNNPYGGNIYAIFKEFTSGSKSLVDEVINFIRPSIGQIINEFDPSSGHLGVDFAVPSGTAVFASLGGLIIFSDYTIDDGNKIIIEHSNGYLTIYKHCSMLIKKEREFVVQGDLIALSGNTGENTSGPHLHFEIWKNGKPINPKELFIK